MQKDSHWRIVLVDGEHVAPGPSKFKVDRSGALFLLDADGTRVRAVWAPGQWLSLHAEAASGPPKARRANTDPIAQPAHDGREKG